jgi:hypothetical protein
LNLLKRNLFKNIWMALSLCSSAAYSRISGWRFHCVQAQPIQEYLDGAFTLFKRSLFKNNWMALSLCSSAAYSRISGWRFHCVQAQPIQE